jgi:Tol biopolymer transport system component
MKAVVASVIASLLVVFVPTASSPARPLIQDTGGRAVTATADALQVRTVATLAPGLPVKINQLPYALMFSSDGRAVTYFARYQDGDLMKETVVHRGGRGPEASFILQAALSPDGSKVAYLASFRDDVKAAYLIIGNRRDRVQIKAGRSDPQWAPVFSGDGKRLAYKAETPGGKRVIRVADVSEIPPESHTSSDHTPLTSVSGPEFDDVDQAQFTPDGAHFTYAARTGGKWVIVVDGKPGATYLDADSPVLRPDGAAVAFRATRDRKKYFVVVGGEEGPPFDMISPVAYSPDGTTVGYAAKEGGKYWLVNGADRKPAKSFAGRVVFSADGRRLVGWDIESGSGGKQRLIVDDRRGPEFEQVGWPVFDDSATVAVYWARDKGKFLMVASDARSEPFDGVGRARVLSADGSQVAFGALQGSELRWTVMKIR